MGIAYLSTSEWLTIVGAAFGTLGSIITAFSLNAVVGFFNRDRKRKNITLEGLVRPDADIFHFTGTDKHAERAFRKSRMLAWFGVILLAAGFLLQGAAVVAARSPAAPKITPPSSQAV